MAKPIPHEQVHARLMQNPEYARRWHETEFAHQLATLVIGYRAEHQLSQTALAKRLGTSQPAIARLEAGEHTPSLGTLFRVADLLELELQVNISPKGLELRTA